MTDTIETIKCPACGCKMEKIFIADKGINIDICTNGCGGIYFDNKELQQFKNENDTNYIKNVLAGKNFSPVDENEKRICPSCNSLMAKTQIGGQLGLQIDSCYKCGGIFLDYGELDELKIRLKPAASNTSRQTEYISDTPDIVKEFLNDAKDEINGQNRLAIFNSFSDGLGTAKYSRFGLYSLLRFLF